MQYQILDRFSAPNPNHPFSVGREQTALTARAGEEYAFCLLYETAQDGLLDLSFGPLTGKDTVPAAAFFSIHFDAVDLDGNAYAREVSADAGTPGILWISVNVPQDAQGEYRGEMTLSCGTDTAVIPLVLTVDGVAAEHGWAEPEKLTRLSWLNSDAGCEGGVCGPYTEPTLSDGTVSVLGRDVTVRDNAFPGKIVSHFDKNVRVCGRSLSVTEGVTLQCRTADGKEYTLTASGPLTAEKYKDGFRFASDGQLGPFAVHTVTEVEFDGHVAVRPMLVASRDAELSDIRLYYTVLPGCDAMMTGLGRKGGTCPDAYEYRWAERKHSNAVWIGGVNGGVRCAFRGEDYVEPFVNIYYRHRNYHLSESFANVQNGEAQGLVRITKDASGAHVTASSGARTVQAGDVLDFGFDLLVTPLKELDMNRRFRTRYYHADNVDFDAAQKAGATHVITHHAGEVNPYINYPFLTVDRIRAFADEAHRRGMGAKIYYTVREQSDKTCEIDAMMSLGDEIFPSPVSGQDSILWGEEEDLARFRCRFGENRIPAWLTEVDMSVISDGQSRISNYYVQGLRYLTENAGIDGIYIDDTAYDRTVMRRVRRVLDANGRGKADGDGNAAPRLVDLHSWNHFCRHAGFANCLNLYLPLLPYIDSVWMGEAFDHLYESPEFWLTELAPVPYGVPGELLISDRDATDTRYRGMLFGVTFRTPWIKDDVTGLWRFIEQQNLKDAALWGFWNDETPARADRDDVKVSLYRQPDRLVLAVANWAKETVSATLTLDVPGFDLENAVIPEIDNYQSETPFDGSVTMERNKGYLIVIPRISG